MAQFIDEEQDAPMTTLCVEGWRSIHHSYALVNQWQLLALLKRTDVNVTVRDVPYYRKAWQPTVGLFDAGREKALAGIPTCNLGDIPAAIYRISFPYDFSLSSAARTAVFGTAELQTVVPSCFAAPVDVARLSESQSFVVITPSRWSREGFLRMGLRPEQVRVVPHGVDTDIFSPLRGDRRATREQLRLSGFTFANASVMTENKGIDVLLRAFCAVAEQHPEAHLLLKGVDALFASQKYLNHAISKLTTRGQRLVVDRLRYYGGTLSVDDMANFYRAADVYVSPYLAEGFNLPVLEASACATPIICTKGGPTDEFTDDTFALRIASKLMSHSDEDGAHWYLEPSVDHLVDLMLRSMRDDEWRQRASAASARYAAANCTWDMVAGKLLDAIFAR